MPLLCEQWCFNAGPRFGTHELYLMCDDVKQTIAELKRQGVEFTQPIKDQGWGLVTRLKVPGGGDMGLYEPRHARPK